MKAHIPVTAARIGAVCCALLLALSGCPQSLVYFPDPALESAVRAAINKPFGPLTGADCLEVRELEAAGLGIRNLEGLEHCRYATSINLRSNRVQNIRALENLNDLQWLDLGDNIVRNIEPLSGLLQLQYANLFGADQDVWDFSPLVANALAPGSDLPSGTAILPVHTTLYSDGTLQEQFAEDFQLLTNAGVTVIFAEPDGTEVQL